MKSRRLASLTLCLALWSLAPLTAQISEQVPAPAESAHRVGRILIPRLNLDLPLLEMSDVQDQKTLNRGPAHLAGTSYPGQAGNCVIAGHRSTFTSPFRKLGELHQGDTIILQDPQGGSHRYQIGRIFPVRPDQVEVISPTETATVTLITCHPLNSNQQRLIVQGRLVDAGPPG